MRKILFTALQLFFTMVVLSVLSASGATLTVTKTDDTNDGACDADCSLREAISAANPNDTVEFAAPLFETPQVITLSNANGFQQLLILKNIIINGKGANLLTIRRVASSSIPFRIFAVGGTANVVLQGITITGGYDTGGGGGILNDNSATLTINNCHIRGNVAEFNGGGIRNVAGTVNVNNTTFSGNIAGIFNGGGIASTGGTFNITNSTISGNYSNNGQVGAGGVWASDGTMNITNSTIANNSSIGIQQNAPAIVTVRNSIVAQNQVFIRNPDVVGAFVSSGYNLVGYVGSATGFGQTGDRVGTSSAILDSQLAPLGDYGGKTPTHAPLTGSPAINTADPNNQLAADQRSVPRPVGSRADIGAVERNISFTNTPNGGINGLLPNGVRGQAYNVQFSAARIAAVPSLARSESNFSKWISDLAPFTFSLVAGNLPPGLTLDPSGNLSGIPTAAGDYDFILKALDADGMGGAQAYSLTVLAPTAARVSVAGRVLTPDGRGLQNARVTLTFSTGAALTAGTGTFGYFHFTGIPAGEIVVVQVQAKRFQFAAQVVNINEALEELNFYAVSPLP